MRRLFIHPISFALLLLLWVTGCGEKPKAVILISLDTLRQDHLGCYGYGRDTTPCLDRLAGKEAILFENAYAQAPFTLPSHMTMLTGMYPETHGILLPVLEDDTEGSPRLSDRVTTLAEIFQANDYDTMAFTDGGMVNKRYGFDQGFDEYRDARIPAPEKNGFRKYRKDLHQWLRDHEKDDFFLFLHTFDTHAPFVPPEPFLSRFRGAAPGRPTPSGSLSYCELTNYHKSFYLEQFTDLQHVIDVYDGCVAFVDEELDKLFQLLRALDRWEDTLIVITSDHGELFLENGLMIGHGIMSYNEEVRIPLLVKLPGSRLGGTRVEHLVESVDLMPTLLTALELPVPAAVQGQDLILGVEHGQWEKNHAYGLSPNLGNSHYLVMKGIKYMEAVVDPKQWRVLAHLKPQTPPGMPRPPDPYLQQEDTLYFYDKEVDPLGVLELFYRGDRAFDLRKAPAPYEWAAPTLQDEAMLQSYREAVNRLSAHCLEAGKAWADREGTASLTEEEKAALNSLGYAGILDASSFAGRDKTGTGATSRDLDLRPPLVDRTLLNRGDALLRQANRYYRNLDRSMDPGALVIKVKEARAYFDQFHAQYPDKEDWLEWRMNYLEAMVQYLEDEMSTGEEKE